MINIYKARKYCREDISLIENYQQAKDDETTMWFCHHRKGIDHTKKQLIQMGQYYGVEAKDLIFVRPSEHIKLHFWVGIYAKKRRAKISRKLKSRKNHFVSPNFNFNGKHHTEEAKRKIGEASSSRVGMESARIRKDIWEQKDEILKQLALGLSERKIAIRFGCSRTVIANIRLANQ